MENTMKKGLAIKDIALLGMLIATLEVGKIVLNAIPNVEVITLLIVLYISSAFFAMEDVLFPVNVAKNWETFCAATVRKLIKCTTAGRTYS